MAVLTADQIYLLNNYFGPGIAKKLQLGNLLDDALAESLQDLALADGKVLVGDATNTAAAVDLSGAVTIDNAGVVSLEPEVVSNTEIAPDAAIAFSKLASLDDGYILVGDATDVAAKVAVSGDITLANDGTVAIASGAIVNADVNASAAIAYSKLALTGSVAVADHAPAVMAEATGTLTQANIQAMNGAPVQLVAAPGAGKLIIVDEIELFHDYDTAAYTGGGDVSIIYATSATPIQVFDVAVVTDTADANFIMKPSASYTSSASTSSATDLSTSINKAVQITNATAAFADGDAANIVKFRVRYHTITALV